MCAQRTSRWCGSESWCLDSGMIHGFHDPVDVLGLVAADSHLCSCGARRLATALPSRRMVIGVSNMRFPVQDRLSGS